MDKTGNGYAVIRFLPAPNGEDLPWAKVWSHAFQGPGGWYIENSLTTLGQKDPLADYNRELWNSGLDSDKEIARKQKRKLSYYSNIYVVKDPANPQNEARVVPDFQRVTPCLRSVPDRNTPSGTRSSARRSNAFHSGIVDITPRTCAFSPLRTERCASLGCRCTPPCHDQR